MINKRERRKRRKNLQTFSLILILIFFSLHLFPPPPPPPPSPPLPPSHAHHTPHNRTRSTRPAKIASSLPSRHPPARLGHRREIWPAQAPVTTRTPTRTPAPDQKNIPMSIEDAPSKTFYGTVNNSNHPIQPLLRFLNQLVIYLGLYELLLQVYFNGLSVIELSTGV